MSIKFILTNITSAAFGATGKESVFGSVVAAAGTFIAAAMGGGDIAIHLLVYLMIADYVSGVLGAIKGKKVNSDIMFWGGA
ncbi:phage-related holin [Bacillus sp. 3255]|nr:phage holin family protein [Bacillus sp. 3255]MDR6880371.1 phage-related holin [Bacillus sp. 3255]